MQMDLLQTQLGILTLVPKADIRERHAELRPNLLALTALVADSYEDEHEQTFFATRVHVIFEQNLLKYEIAKLSEKTLLLELGCATGRVAREFSPNFKRVVGYDLSREMTRVAQRKAEEKGLNNVEFRVTDLEHGIPEANESVSFVVVNLGTASDLLNIGGFFEEVWRVLKPGGRFLVSFYNRDALLYASFVPWQVALAAVVHVERNCIDVHVDDNKLLSVYAHAYTVKQVQDLFSNEPELQVEAMSTHPTVCSILPNEFFDEQSEAQLTMLRLEQEFSKGAAGAYITVTGWKGPLA
jgi:SAM-dependent methyltransferase